MKKRPTDLQLAEALELRALKLREKHANRRARLASKDVRRLERDLAVLERYEHDAGETEQIGTICADVTETLERLRKEASAS